MSNVTEDFGAESSKELSFSYAVISSRSLFRITSGSGMLTPAAHVVRSLAQQTRLTGSVGFGMSAM